MGINVTVDMYILGQRLEAIEELVEDLAGEIGTDSHLVRDIQNQVAEANIYVAGQFAEQATDYRIKRRALEEIARERQKISDR